MKDLNEWFDCDDLLEMGFIPSSINKDESYPTFLELGRIKVFYMSFDHWQILPPGVEFDSDDVFHKRVRVYTLRSLITLIYEWYELKDYEHLNLPKIDWV